MRVIHVTTHIGLIDAIAKIEPGLVERTIARGHSALVSARIADPRIAVCGINPHAGENGLFGYGEEEDKDSSGPLWPAERRDGASRVPCLPIRCSFVPSAAISILW